MNNSTYIPHLYVHPTSVTVAPKRSYAGQGSLNKTYSHLLVSQRKHKDSLSSTAARKIRKACTYLYASANTKRIPGSLYTSSYNFKISVITLTLSSRQIHPDKVIVNKLLNQFLIEAKKYWKVDKYLWRAEKQKNGNLHFHIVIDKYVHWNEIRNVWNRIQNKLGYVDRYREEMLKFHAGGFKVREDLLKTWSYKSQIKAYSSGKANDWNNPNSIDVHSLKFINNLEAYLIKYLTKEYQNKNVSCSLWSSSRNLTNLSGGRDIYNSHVSSEFKRLKASKNTRYYETDYFTTLSFNVDVLNSVDYPYLYNLLQTFIIKHFNNTT